MNKTSKIRPSLITFDVYSALVDYSAGLNFGWKLSKHLGLFVEGEYTKMWDSELFQSSVGLNFSFK